MRSCSPIVTSIYLVRHAHSNFDLSIEETRGLSEQGWEDAKRVTEVLLEEGIEVVASSSYVRAVQTVQETAEKLGVEVIVDPRLRERDLATRSGSIPREEFPSMMKKVFAEPDFAFPEGESNNQVLARALAALHDLMHNHPGRKIAVGFHGNIMTILMGHFDVRYDLAFGHTLEKPDIYKLDFEGDQYLGTERIWKGRVL